MKSNDRKSSVREYVAAFNRGDVEGVCRCFAPDAVVYGVLGWGGPAKARPIWEQLVSCFRLHQDHQKSAAFSISILVIAVLAMTPVAFAPRCLPFPTLLMLRLLGLFPLFVFLTVPLHLFGRNAWIDWLVERLRRLRV